MGYKHSKTMKIARALASWFSLFTRVSQTLEYNENHSGYRPNDFHCFLVFVTPGNTLALVYEILHHISTLKMINTLHLVLSNKKNNLSTVLFLLQFCTPGNKFLLLAIVRAKNCGIRTHAIEITGALNQRLRPLGHATFAFIAHRCPH